MTREEVALQLTLKALDTNVVKKSGSGISAEELANFYNSLLKNLADDEIAQPITF